jgi:hypothetical protein
MPDMPLLMIDYWSFSILTCELILEAVHMGGGATVVERFDDGVQMNVGAVQMIRIGDVLMNLVSVVGMILVFGARILGVDWLI